MEAEGAGRPDEAKALFEQAWEIAEDEYERCIAAHYLARHQDGPQETLRWNAESLRCADCVGDVRVAGFYPSLYLNMGRAHEQLGESRQAEECFRAAEAHLPALPAGPYGDMVRDAVKRGLLRLRGGATAAG
jgi:tetratricopeptide (TPR) repeat protein